ncbi:MAG: hypothetical protein WD904_05650 [Dehalococcoidia bacterium]
MTPSPSSSGVPSIEALATALPTLAAYVAAASDYVRLSSALSLSQKKTGQIRLSAALGVVLAAELRNQVPWMHPLAGERDVSGGLRIAKADVSEIHPLDGLRLAVEIKPVNLAVGRAIWNRFGDIRMFAVNLHLKFPFAVLGGVLAIPTYEESSGTGGVARRSTVHLINRAVARLSRAGGRRTEGDAPHLLEGVGVLVYDPDAGVVDPDIPPAGSGLRWDEFISAMAIAYAARFEE